MFIHPPHILFMSNLSESLFWQMFLLRPFPLLFHRNKTINSTIWLWNYQHGFVRTPGTVTVTVSGDVKSYQSVPSNLFISCLATCQQLTFTCGNVPIIIYVHDHAMRQRYQWTYCNNLFINHYCLQLWYYIHNEKVIINTWHKFLRTCILLGVVHNCQHFLNSTESTHSETPTPYLN